VRVQQELDGVWGPLLGPGGGDTPGPEDLARMPLLAACVDETLRLFPAAPLTGRVALEDDELDGFKIPAGTVSAAHSHNFCGRQQPFDNSVYVFGRRLR
jgi:cytochrome P450